MIFPEPSPLGEGAVGCVAERATSLTPSQSPYGDSSPQGESFFDD